MKSRHVTTVIVLVLFLFLLMVLTVSISGAWNIRQLYTVIFYTCVNTLVFSLNKLIFARQVFNKQTNAFLHLVIASVYTSLHILLTLTYFFTGQVTRLQTVFFSLGVAPSSMIILALSGLGVAILILLYFVHRKYAPNCPSVAEKTVLQRLFVSSIVVLLLLYTLNVCFLKIENPIITNEDLLVTYNAAPEVLGERISRIPDAYAGKNVVFILLESITATRLGYYGYERNVSPNLDYFAANNIVFTNASSTATHSDYAQPAILSSRYQLTNGLRTAFTDNSPRTFIWDVFREHNYTTAYFSSQDDRWENMDGYLRTQNLDVYRYSLTDGKTDYGSGLAMKDYDHKTADAAIHWLDTVQNKSFFLYLNFQATHDPQAYPSEFNVFGEETYSSRYDNALHYVDAQVGKILGYLDTYNLTNDTVILITSDHGHDLEKSHGISGHGYSLYDDELHVPLLAHIPGVAHTVVTDRVSHIDIAPTLVDLFNYTIPSDFQGTVMHKNKPLFFITQNHLYLIGELINDTKIIIDMNRKLVEVYDLAKDPDELHPLDSTQYDKQILTLLFWHYCQLDYYKYERWNSTEVNRCMVNNNFVSNNS